MERAFNHAKRACYAGLDSVTLRREIANRVSAVVPFDAHAFSTCDPDTGIMSHTVAEGIPAELARLYVEVLYPEVLALMPMEMPRRGENVFSMVEEAPRMGSALSALGIKEETHVSISSGDRLWGSWCLMRSSAPSSRSAKSFPFLKRLAPHIARGLQSAALIDRALANNPSGVESASGVIILDHANRPTLQTESAMTWLADLRDIGLSARDDIPLAIIGLAWRLRQPWHRERSQEHVRVRGLSGAWYTLRASLSIPNQSGESSVVVVISPAMPLEVAAILTRLYGFSAREREVTAAVARGEATKTIAAALGVSPHTVTEHIDRACDKLGVSGRKALVAKLFFEGYAPHLRSIKPTI